MRFTTTLVALILAAFSVLADNKKIDKETLNGALSAKVCPIDSEANAYIVFENHTIDIGLEQVFETTYYWVQTEHIHRVIKIVNKSAEDLAKVRFTYPADDNLNRVYELTATTYNKEGAAIRETNLNKDDFYKKSLSKDWNEISFSFPSVKPGSVIEYSYTKVTAAESVLPTWDIQEDYPKLLSLYEVSYPDDFKFTSIAHTMHPIKACATRETALKCPDDFATTAYKIDQGTCNFWVRKNITALREEPFVNNLPNFSEDLILQKAGDTWEKFNTSMRKSDIVSGMEKNSSRALDDLLDNILSSAQQPADTMRAIYSYVRSHFTADDDRSIRTHRMASELINTHIGSNAEINMLLCCLLTRAGFDAYPVVLATLGNKSLTPVFPIKHRVNYLACAVQNNTGYTMLDASDKHIPYGMLPTRCYNGFAWIITEKGVGIDLNPSVLSERNVTYVKVSGFSDSSADLEILRKVGLIQSASVRRGWAADKKAKQKYIDNLKEELASGTSIDEVNILNENNADTNLVVIRKGKLTWNKNTDHLFFNTAQFSRHSNPFTASSRYLPVEFPCQLHDQYAVYIQLPENLEPADLPNSSAINLDSTAMTFRKSYNYMPGTHMLLINTSYDRTVTVFDAENYTQLRDFLSEVMKKEDEVITLKKTK